MKKLFKISMVSKIDLSDETHFPKENIDEANL